MKQKNYFSHRFTFFRTLCLFVLLEILAGCCPTIESVKRISNQHKLAKIACSSCDLDVRLAAVEKLTDQSLLKKVFHKSRYINVSAATLKNISDQDFLEEIAERTCDSDESYIIAAATSLSNEILRVKFALRWENKGQNRNLIFDEVSNSLTNPIALATMALKSNDKKHSCTAYRKLVSSGSLVELSTFQEDPCVKLCALFYNACQIIPESSHRDRVSEELLAIIGPLGSDPLIRAQLGNIDDISIKWDRIAWNYSLGFTPGNYKETYCTVEGERVAVFVRMSNVSKPFSWCWKTDLKSREMVPQGASYVWKSAEFLPYVWQQDIYNNLSESTINRLAIESESLVLRSAAVNKIKDQSLLAKIAIEDKNLGVRLDAIKNINDRSILAKIVYCLEQVERIDGTYDEYDDKEVVDAILNRNREGLVAPR